MADAYDFWAERLPSAERAAVAAFWEGFERHAAFIDAIFTGEDRAGTADDVADCMAEALGPLSDGIYWEFGPLDEGGKRGHFLALTPELYHSKRPLARALVATAPDLPGWAFGDARRPIIPASPAARGALAGVEETSPSQSRSTASPITSENRSPACPPA
ncbi:MAG: hypothetical protein AAF968_20605, partial [Pseudomonadota bacterium]